MEFELIIALLISALQALTLHDCRQCSSEVLALLLTHRYFYSLTSVMSWLIVIRHRKLPHRGHHVTNRPHSASHPFGHMRCRY